MATLREEEAAGIAALREVGIDMKVCRDDPDYPQDYFEHKGERITVSYSTYRKTYNFFIRSKEERMIGSHVSDSVAILPELNKVHKPNKAAILRYADYLVTRQEAIKAYFASREAERETERQEIKALGAELHDYQGAERWTASTVCFTLEYDFEDFNYTSKKLEFHGYRAESTDIDIFNRAKKAGL